MMSHQIAAEATEVDVMSDNYCITKSLVYPPAPFFQHVTSYCITSYQYQYLYRIT